MGNQGNTRVSTGSALHESPRELLRVSQDVGQINEIHGTRGGGLAGSHGTTYDLHPVLHSKNACATGTLNVRNQPIVRATRTNTAAAWRIMLGESASLPLQLSLHHPGLSSTVATLPCREQTRAQDLHPHHASSNGGLRCRLKGRSTGAAFTPPSNQGRI